MTEAIEIYNGASFKVLNGNEIWATQKDMATAFEINVPAISKHVNNILQSGELERDEVVSKMEITATDGKNYMVDHYNLDMIIAVGFRVESVKGTAFRRWANGVLKKYMVEGVVVNPKMTADDMKRVFDLVVSQKRDLERQEQLLAEQRQTIRKMGDGLHEQTATSIRLQGELMRQKVIADRFAPIGDCPDGYYERRGSYCRKPQRRKVDTMLARQLLLGIPQKDVADGE